MKSFLSTCLVLLSFNLWADIHETFADLHVQTAKLEMEEAEKIHALRIEHENQSFEKEKAHLTDIATQSKTMVFGEKKQNKEITRDIKKKQRDYKKESRSAEKELKKKIKAIKKEYKEKIKELRKQFKEMAKAENNKNRKKK